MIYKGTTILGLGKEGKFAMGGDGQVTLEQTIVKQNAKKIRKLYNNTILAGFAGATSAPHPDTGAAPTGPGGRRPP